MDSQKLLAALSLEEKCALLSGKTTFGTRALPKHGIPAILCADGPHGLRKQSGSADHLGLAESEKATCFPTASCMACSWDPVLGEEIGAALGAEAAAQGVSVLLGPGLNMKRSPLCGRNFEYFSEDPYLAGKMAAGYIRGIQSGGVAACPKHFAVNNQETRRMASDSIVDERTLREIYLTGFEIAVQEGRPKSIMSSYNRLNGVYANENAHLLKEILRDEWGFDGAVITDWGGSSDHVLGVKNGSTLEMPAPGLSSARELLSAVKKGDLTEAEIDARVSELLSLIDGTRQAIDDPPPYDAAAHHQLARKAAGESIVLLKNEDHILPLAAGTRVALIGDFAEHPRYQGAGSSIVNPTRTDSLLQEIRAGGLVCAGYSAGFLRTGGANPALADEAVRLAEQADVVLCCLGLNEAAEQEGAERRDMHLAENQIRLLERLSAVNENTVVLLFCGSPVETPWLDHAKALLYAGLGGQAGAGALLDVIEGRLNPSGKLAESWPLFCEDAPAAAYYPAVSTAAEYREGPFIGYRYYETAAVPVRFCFGQGLSYTTFAYSDLSVSRNAVRFTLTNTGSIEGTEIAQVYVSLPSTGIYRPARELKGFARVSLAPGDAIQVTIPLDGKAFRFWNPRIRAWDVENGVYEISVGASVQDIRLTGTLAVNDGTGVLPSMEGLSLYRNADVKNVPDAAFEALLDKKIPMAEKAKIDRNMTFGDLRYGRSPIFLLVWLVLHLMKKSGEKNASAGLNLLFVYNMPLRALARLTGGLIDMHMVDGIVLEVRGFWIIGLLWTVISFVRNLLKNLWMERQIS